MVAAAVVTATCLVPALADARQLPVCSRDPATGGEVRCATVKPPGAWAKAAAYRANAYPLPRPRVTAVLAPMVLKSITVTRPNRIDEGECGYQVTVLARYAGGGEAMTYEYLETDCGGLTGGVPVDIPGAGVARGSVAGRTQVVEWTTSSRADVDGGLMISQMALSSRSLSRDRLIAIARTIR